MRGELSRTVLRGLAGSDARPATRLALVTTHDGDVPLFMRPLDGNSSDKSSISATVTQVLEQLRASEPVGQEEPLAVFDSGGYSQANMKVYNEAKIRWSFLITVATM